MTVAVDALRHKRRPRTTPPPNTDVRRSPPVSADVPRAVAQNSRGLSPIRPGPGFEVVCRFSPHRQSSALGTAAQHLLATRWHACKLTSRTPPAAGNLRKRYPFGIRCPAIAIIVWQSQRRPAAETGSRKRGKTFAPAAVGLANRGLHTRMGQKPVGMRLPRPRGRHGPLGSWPPVIVLGGRPSHAMAGRFEIC